MSRIEYERRINKVIDRIENSIAEELSVSSLAKTACFSKYHFHRLFKGLVGENITEFIQRRRLETAASKLLNSKTSILNIALDCGYENAASFSKAFRRHFTMSASEWRKGKSNDWMKTQIQEKNLATVKNSNIGKEINHKIWQKLQLEGEISDSGSIVAPHVIEIPSYLVAYKRYTGTYGDTDITLLWDKLMRWADRHNFVNNELISFGVVHNDPRLTAAGKCRYDASVVIPEKFSDPDVATTRISGGKYLAYNFEGSPLEIDDAWDRVYAQHLPDCGYFPAAKPNLEYYKANAIVDIENLIFRCKLCVPLQETELVQLDHNRRTTS